MKNRMINSALIVSAILLQRFLYQTVDFEWYQIPFASSLMTLQNENGNLLLILYAFVPIPFILFEFSGRGRALTEGYGKLWVIRAYKREHLCVNAIGKSIIELFVIILFQTIVFLPFDQKWQDITGSQMSLILMMYGIGMLNLVLLQFYLEFMMETNYANVLTNIFFVVSLFIGSRVLRSEIFYWVGLLLFPNMLFGTRNGAIYQETGYIHFEYAVITMLMLTVLLCLLIVMKFRKKDIF